MNRERLVRWACVVGVVTTTLLSSCLTPRSSQMIETPSGEWSESSPAEWRLEEADTLQPQDLWVVARLARSFPFTRFALELSLIDPQGYHQVDTLWLETHAAQQGATYPIEIEEPWLQGVRFEETGPYLFRFRPLMPAEGAAEVEAVGVRWAQAALQ